MAQYKFAAQNNVGFPQTFNMSVPAPLIANRIFETLADAENFLNQPTCIPGLILRVIKDTDNNAAYRVGYQTGNDGPLALFRLSEGQGGQENVIEHVFVKTDDEPVELEITDKGVTIDLTDYVTENELDSKLVDKFVQSTRIVEGFIDPDGNFHEKEADPVTQKMLPYLEIVVNKEDGDVTDGKVFYIDLSRFTDTYYGEDAKDTEAVNDPYSPNVPSITIDSNNHIHVSREWIAGYIKDLATNESVTNAINNFKRDIVDPLEGLVNNKADQSDLEALEERVETLEQKPCDVTDVQVNGTSVVENGIANIDLSNYATKDEIPTDEHINDLAGTVTGQAINDLKTDVLGVPYVADPVKKTLNYVNEKGEIESIKNAELKQGQVRPVYEVKGEEDQEPAYFVVIEKNLYKATPEGDYNPEDLVGSDVAITPAVSQDATGMYAAMQGATNRTIASIAAELDGIVAEGGEPNLINEIVGENAAWEAKGSDEFVNIKVTGPVNKVVTLDSKVKTANAAVDMDGNISYGDGLMTSKDFEIMTGWTVLN